MKKNLIVIYYAVLILVLSSQAIYTVYRLGGTVGQGEKLHRLQQQQLALEKELQLLQEKHYSQNSLAAITPEDTAGYHTIERPIIISAGESVASR
jgi:ubiquinone biosynthesis protein Coq4